MSNKEGMAKNLQVCKDEWADYKQACGITMTKVRSASGLWRKLHHLSGMGPDIHRFMPRTLWYGSVILGVFGWVLVGFVVWKVW